MCVDRVHAEALRGQKGTLAKELTKTTTVYPKGPGKSGHLVA